MDATWRSPAPLAICSAETRIKRGRFRSRPRDGSNVAYWQGLARSEAYDISRDGAVILLVGDSDSETNTLHVWRRADGVSRSLGATTPRDGWQYNAPSLSGDGRLVAYRTSRGELAVLDIERGHVELVKARADMLNGRADLSFDGQYLAFSTNESLVLGDINFDQDVYLLDRRAGVMVNVSAPAE